MVRDISEHKYLFHQGNDYRSYEFLGAHLSQDGVVFRVWAPRADAVSVVGSFNGWNPDAHPMRQLSDDGEIWEAFVPEAKFNDIYKFAITARHSAEPGSPQRTVWKADPYAFFSENGSDPGNQRASIVYGISGESGLDAAFQGDAGTTAVSQGDAGTTAVSQGDAGTTAAGQIEYGPDIAFQWGDEDWMEARKSANIYRAPINIYEVHLGSWRRHEDGHTMTYRETADTLIDYVIDMGYTHIELLPVMEHPFDGSWGYQITGYFSPTSRYGRPEELKYLINKAHQNGIGIILDWVPAHFPKDEYGLAEFDGQPLYEYTDKLKAEHKGWGTYSFDFGRPEVISFLISNAFYYCEQFHVDGLRVDAVAAMLYLNYGREDGEWMPNAEGGVGNLEAISFLRKMNHDVLSNFPGVITVAEESTAWPMITKPPYAGGLGFNFKWNMGWMNDGLEYFETDPIFRKHVHGKITFSIDYAWSENYILPISHDEVVHGKKSLLNKMPGGYDSKFDGFRTFMTYMFTHPGKKLTFMGTEFAHFTEWDESRQLDWVLLDYDRHRQAKDFVRDLNHLYLNEPALWIGDDVVDGFRWIYGGNSEDNVLAFMRFGIDMESATEPHSNQIGECSPLVICLNLSGRDIDSYKVGVPFAEEYVALIDTDAEVYGGRGIRSDAEVYGGRGNRAASSYKAYTGAWNGFDNHIVLSLPALSGIILKKKEG